MRSVKYYSLAAASLFSIASAFAQSGTGGTGGTSDIVPPSPPASAPAENPATSTTAPDTIHHTPGDTSGATGQGTSGSSGQGINDANVRSRETATGEPSRSSTRMQSGANSGYGGSQWGTHYNDRSAQNRLQPGDQDYNLYGGN